MTRIEKRDLERLQYWQGQMVRSRDFRDNEAVEAQRRWWHNRAEHAAFGISLGLEASKVDSAVTAVLVRPGLAYDCFGRELILDSAQTVPVPLKSPPNVRSLVLLMKYLSPEDGDRSTATPEVCWTDSHLKKFDAFEFLWKPKEAVRAEDGVPIAQVFYTATVREINLEFFRRPTQADARPTVATGTTLRGKTPWQAQRLGVVDDIGKVVEVRTRVDTSAGGFTSIPCYFGWLGGPLLDPKTGVLLPVLFTSIRDEAADGFTFAYWLFIPNPISNGPNPLNAATAEMASSFEPVPRPDLIVNWIGCQMPVPIPFVPLRDRTSNQLVLKNIVKQ